MKKEIENNLKDISDYYSEKLSLFGPTPAGVDWNGDESQRIRFETLCGVIGRPGGFSINDLGCGYGGLLKFLEQRFSNFKYVGIDLSEQMIASARKQNKLNRGARFVQGTRPDSQAEYGIASGIFNVRLERSDQEWLAFVEATLDQLNETSTRGFSFNCLTSYSDREKMRSYLYYADPCKLFDICKRRYSPQVALLHDYGLFEFTIIVRKQA